jgi:hypothetical protein
MEGFAFCGCSSLSSICLPFGLRHWVIAHWLLRICERFVLKKAIAAWKWKEISLWSLKVSR